MRRNQLLRDFLRSRRARVAPEDAGLPLGPGSRRVPGLRREEVANLAGISVDYYIRFEQGRCPNVSDALLDSVAVVLRLTPVERLYLYEVARPSSRPPVPAAPQRVSDGVRLLLANLSAPAFVLGRRLDLLAANETARALHQGLEGHGNYLRWLILDTASHTLCADWDLAAREATAMLRINAARRPHDLAITALVEELSGASPAFRRIWDAHEVDVRREGRRRYRHPVVGEIVLHSERFNILNEPDQALFTYNAVPGSSSAAALRRLAPATDLSGVTQTVRGTTTVITGLAPLEQDTDHAWTAAARAG
jgi:transcriptional regulator with XRE-family HTH domain